jgi:hypothetical protein
MNRAVKQLMLEDEDEEGNIVSIDNPCVWSRDGNGL